MKLSNIQISSAGNGWIKLRGNSCEETQELVTFLKEQARMARVIVRPKSKRSDSEVEVPAIPLIRFLLCNYYGV